MLGAVAGHELLHLHEQFIAVLRRIHIDEVDDHDSSHIAKPHLTGYFLSSEKVDFQGVLLLVNLGVADAAVDVDDVQGLCVLDDQIGAFLHRNDLAERTLDLAGNVEMVENRSLGIVVMDYLLLLG